MINRLPLDLFNDADEPASAPAEREEISKEPAGDGVDQIIKAAPAETAAADILLVACQWCSTQFDNELPSCPECNAKHVRVQPPEEEPATTTCQWCLTTFDSGPETCPECNAHVVVPGQNVPGEHDAPLDYNSMGMLARRAHTNQMLAGMMLGGGLDSLAGGLIGLALFILDDD